MHVNKVFFCLLNVRPKKLENWAKGSCGTWGSWESRRKVCVKSSSSCSFSHKDNTQMWVQRGYASIKLGETHTEPHLHFKHVMNVKLNHIECKTEWTYIHIFLKSGPCHHTTLVYRSMLSRHILLQSGNAEKEERS